ncbi:succinate dehydrogenase/fumarate reductase cytochrome b subunit [Helicobacter monodelphidis]|uniref:fumarate reductase cytochrome b subunit n=1 Tax=Helicobacter sp. 15-1451 TaxID=2004995 RepID=UPI000DCDDC7A|nr:fumarate reductase cytochrome b subunit [Helicobacter sp. 15-1451]RAX57699.1 succinate dehydrogenase/fumarate reductase cytochrome b subunit [Helicobacter sp. 15-1451]
MRNEEIVEGYLGITTERKKSRLPAKLDFWQSATGAFLGLFMIAHMFFVSSILLGGNAMYAITKFFEGSFIFGAAGQPLVVSGVAVIVILAFVTHAFLALRKFPINYRQFMLFRTHKNMMRHSDTSLWWIQALSGFALFFLASVHLYTVLVQPHTIGPEASGFRFVHQHYWLLYIVLLFCVELHASIGLYRLCVKWGWFENFGLQTLRTIKKAMSAFFIILGLCTFAAYVVQGMNSTATNIEEARQNDWNNYGPKGVN